MDIPLWAILLSFFSAGVSRSFVALRSRPHAMLADRGLDSVPDRTDNLGNRPEDKASFILRYLPTDALQLVWATLLVGEFFDSSIPTGDVELDGYNRTDISADYRYKQVVLTFAVDNLFDERYEQYVGFVDPGRRARAGITARF